LALKLRGNLKEKSVMETFLIVASIGWMVAGVNLLLGYNKEAELRNAH
jgi:hypothetical protein